MICKCFPIFCLFLIAANKEWSKELLDEKVHKVFRPVQNRVFLAGEHISVDHPATTESAVQSDEATARMLSLIKPVKEKETTGPGS